MLFRSRNEWMIMRETEEFLKVPGSSSSSSKDGERCDDLFNIQLSDESQVYFNTLREL